jgi:hypothetical protein
MGNGRVDIDGVQFLRRRTREQITPLHQEVSIGFDGQAVAYEVRGMESGQRLRVPSDDPAVIQHYRDIDHANFVVSIAERPPIPEPERIPDGIVPFGKRRCDVCEGVGSIDSGDGWLDCEECGGIGVVDDDAR